MIGGNVVEQLNAFLSVQTTVRIAVNAVHEFETQPNLPSFIVNAVRYHSLIMCIHLDLHLFILYAPWPCYAIFSADMCNTKASWWTLVMENIWYMVDVVTSIRMPTSYRVHQGSVFVPLFFSNYCRWYIIKTGCCWHLFIESRFWHGISSLQSEWQIWHCNIVKAASSIHKQANKIYSCLYHSSNPYI